MRRQQAPTLVERAGCLARTAAPQPLGASRSKRRRLSSARERQGPTHDDKADEDGRHGPAPLHPFGDDENGGVSKSGSCHWALREQDAGEEEMMG